ncbi:MAG TPA: VWA domain-containing protein [Bryobacteraceae bacterium]|nr:VWA domain-containing protein [Bryobacteraceae bacterium]
MTSLRWFAVVCLSAAFALQAQPPARNLDLRVVAVDSAGQPVSGLTASDFKVYDNGSPQKVLSVHLNQTGGPSALVILFDLLNSSLASRGQVWEIMKRSLAHVPSSGNLYLYLLVDDGSLYPVHPLGSAEGAPDAKAAAANWVENIASELDDAMRKTSQLRPQDLRRDSPVGISARFNATCRALDELRAHMAPLAGTKELLWVTYGIPSTIPEVGHEYWDATPTLRQLGARFQQSGVVIYSADPGMNLARGILDREGLDILTGVTGGRTFANVDLNRAITQAESDARTNYSVEFEPSGHSWNGKFHKLRVAVARKGVHVQAENGYFAIAGS